MAGRSLSAEEAAKLLALPTRTRGASGGITRAAAGTGKSVRIDTTDRSWPMWWKLPVTLADCTVPGHDHIDDKGNPVERSRMCAKVGDNMVCRYCYVTSRDVSSS